MKVRRSRNHTPSRRLGSPSTRCSRASAEPTESDSFDVDEEVRDAAAREPAAEQDGEDEERQGCEDQQPDVGEHVASLVRDRIDCERDREEQHGHAADSEDRAEPTAGSRTRRAPMPHHDDRCGAEQKERHDVGQCGDDARRPRARGHEQDVRRAVVAA